MRSPDFAGFLDDSWERILHFYLQVRALIPVFLLILYFIFSGFERYKLLSRIAELEYRKDHRDFPVYVDGVKTGLKFKKHQQGHVP